jgi:uncharacterized membrane protein YfcA
MELSTWHYGVLFLSGLAGGWVDSIAGGGGLITIPILLSLGLSPQLALGTNKFQASFGSFTASRHYVRKKVVALADARPGIILTFVGALLGTWAVQQMDPGFLNVLIPAMLLAIALYMLIAPRVSDSDGNARMSRIFFYSLFSLPLGFYDGFFGPGVGSFWAFAFISALGFNLRKATGYTKVMNFTSNVVAFLLFALYGNVLWVLGLTMAAGQIVGAGIGSALVVRRGARFIRPIFIAVVLLTTLKLLCNRLS